MAMAQQASLSCSTATWRELTNTSWRDDDYRRMVMAYLIEAVYLLELERQERRDAAAVAQQWWKPFQYRLAHELVDDRDGSVFGAIFERDHHADADGRPSPSGAPSAVVAFRGTLLRGPTIRRVARVPPLQRTLPVPAHGRQERGQDGGLPAQGAPLRRRHRRQVARQGAPQRGLRQLHPRLHQAREQQEVVRIGCVADADLTPLHEPNCTYAIKTCVCVCMNLIIIL